MIKVCFVKTPSFSVRSYLGDENTRRHFRVSDSGDNVTDDFDDRRSRSG